VHLLYAGYSLFDSAGTFGRDVDDGTLLDLASAPKAAAFCESGRPSSNYAEVVVRRQEADMTIWPT
jgi:hypothetical protein